MKRGVAPIDEGVSELIENLKTCPKRLVYSVEEVQDAASSTAGGTSKTIEDKAMKVEMYLLVESNNSDRFVRRTVI
jgi:hypothetical protein